VRGRQGRHWRSMPPRPLGGGVLVNAHVLVEGELPLGRREVRPEEEARPGLRPLVCLAGECGLWGALCVWRRRVDRLFALLQIGFANNNNSS
jgi:hypothetical protein